MIDRSCVILCGGRSSRMGTNKSLLIFNQKPILAYLLEKYKKIFKKVYLCCKVQHLACYQEFDTSILIEVGQDFSPMFGLYTSLSLLGEDIFIVPVDCLFLEKRHFEIFDKQWNQLSCEILYAQTKNYAHYLTGIYSPYILESLQDSIEQKEYRLSCLMQKCLSKKLEFDDEESFSNLNTPLEYNNAILRFNDGK